jgi:hypothetical protein
VALGLFGADIGVGSLVIKDLQNILQNGHGIPVSQYTVNHTVKSVCDLAGNDVEDGLCCYLSFSRCDFCASAE